MLSRDQIPKSICLICGTESGPRVVVFGGTHGDETTGIQVVQNLLEALGVPKDFSKKSFFSPLVRGDLFLGIGNPEAVALHKRSVSGVRDLNRCFHESFFESDEAMRLPDQQRAVDLKDLLASADYFFDLHSVSVKETVPFVGLTTFSLRHADICRFIPVHHVLDVNSILGQDVGLPDENIEQTPTTCSWVNRHGGIGLTYEMGYQGDENSVLDATSVIVNLLIAIGTVHESLREQLNVKKQTEQFDQCVYRLIHCERNRFCGFQYANPRYTKSFTSVKSGECIGWYQDGERVFARADGLLVFPAGVHTLDRNQSIFYLAIPTEVSAKISDQ